MNVSPNQECTWMGGGRCSYPATGAWLVSNTSGTTALKYYCSQHTAWAQKVHDHVRPATDEEVALLILGHEVYR